MLFYQILILCTFIFGYALLIFEHQLKINKAAIAILTGTVMWAIYLHMDPSPVAKKTEHLLEHLSGISQVLFFIIGAMTIVELIVQNQGFEVIRRAIMIDSPRRLFWVISLLGFWISSVLDNLTTILVMISLLKQTVEDIKLRHLYYAGLVFVVNVGGAWTPIGDITTTMLWIQGRVNTMPLIASIGIPSILSFIIFCLLFARMIPNTKVKHITARQENKIQGSKYVLLLGVAGLLAVPIMKIVFSFPPFMGMMISLGVIWVITDRLHHHHKENKVIKVDYILTKIDISCVLFFFGILLAVACLDSSKILEALAAESLKTFSDPYFFAMIIGILSSLVDNVPLVAGVIHMFDLTTYPADDVFWSLLAYCAGVGGSLLIIGSAPGVLLMSLKDIQFFWYLRKVSWIALVAFLAGWASIYLMEQIRTFI